MCKRLILLMILWAQMSVLQAVDLSGVVLDEGEPVAMAEIVLANTGSKLVSGSCLSDKQGRFKFEVASGTYSLTITKDDYALVSIEKIDVSKDNVIQNVELVPKDFVDGEVKLGYDSEGCD